MELSELQQILKQDENEHIEYKEAKNNYSVLGASDNRKCLYAYVVALGNESGGTLILGIDDQKNIVGTQSFLNFSDTKSKIYNKTSQRIEICELFDNNKRILVIYIPSRRSGQPLKFYNIPLMRVGDELMNMDDTTHRDILLEQYQDFSSQIVPKLSEKNLDSQATAKMKDLFNRKHGTSIRAPQLLKDLHLVTTKGVTYAGLILLGTQESLTKYLPCAEIIYQYRNHQNNLEYQDRKDFRNSFLLEQNSLWEKISYKNQVTQIQEGFLTREIPFFNEKVIKETILNAISHRDYNDPGSIVIKQSPQEFEILSPGGFLPGVTISNILKQTKSRNRLLAETLQHLGFVQRAGQGMDTIFQESITEGKGLPDLSDTDDFNVVLKISTQVKNIDFLKYLEQIINKQHIQLSLDDILLLQSGVNNEINKPKDKMKKFLDLGIVERIGKTKKRYVLSHNYYKSQDNSGEYTRLVGLERDAKKQLIIQHLKKNSTGAKRQDFIRVFPDSSQQDISNMLQELKQENIIEPTGQRRWSIWKLK